MSEEITAPITTPQDVDITAPLTIPADFEITGGSSLLNHVAVTRFTAIVSDCDLYGAIDSNGVYSWDADDNAFTNGEFKIFKNWVASQTTWYLYYDDSEIAKRVGSELHGDWTVTDANYGASLNVSKGAASLAFSGEETDLTSILNESAYGDQVELSAGDFTYSGLIYDSTTLASADGNNIGTVGGDAIGNHRHLPGGLTIKGKGQRQTKITLAQSGHDTKISGTIFIVLRLSCLSRVESLTVDANARENITNNGVLRVDTLEVESWDWDEVGLKHDPQIGNGPNWELNPHYGCYTLSDDDSILRDCRFVGWTGGGCNIDLTGPLTNEQYGNNIYGHRCVVDGCLYEDPVNVAYGNPYISVVNTRFSTIVKDTVVKFPEDNDFWILGDGLGAYAPVFAFPNHDGTQFINCKAYNCGAMFHRDTLAISHCVMKGCQGFNIGFGVLFQMTDGDICRNINIENNIFEVRNLNGTTKGAAVKITSNASSTASSGIRVENNTFIGTDGGGEYGILMGNTTGGLGVAPFMENVSFRYNVHGYWDGTASTRQLVGELDNTFQGYSLNFDPWYYDSSHADYEGFYSTRPVAKPTVSGITGANAALESLLASLESQGLINDSTTSS